MSSPASSGPPATGQTLAGRAGPFDLLADRGFRSIWIAGAIAATLRWLEILAIGVFVFQMTGSPFLVALMTMLRMLPLALFGAFAGVVADRISRRLLLLLGLAGMGVTSGLLAVLVLAGTIEVWHIGLGAFLNGVFWAADLPVRRTMLGEIAGADRVGTAMGLDAATNNATRMLGPVFGGLLLELIGLDGVYLLSAALYAAAFAMILRAPYIQAATIALGRGVLSNIVEGLRYIRSDRAIVGTLAVTVIFNLWGFPYTAMVPVIGKETLGLGALPIGLLMSADGAGALIGAILVAFYGRAPHYRRLYLYSTFLYIAMALAFSLSPWPVFSGLLLLILGLGHAGFATMQATITFLSAPPEVRSRVMGLLSVCIGAGPLGFLHLGLLADWLGAPAAVAITAAEGLVALLAACLIWPEIRGISPGGNRH